MDVVYLLGQLGHPWAVVLGILVLLAIVIAVSRRYMHWENGAVLHREADEYLRQLWGFK